MARNDLSTNEKPGDTGEILLDSGSLFLTDAAKRSRRCCREIDEGHIYFPTIELRAVATKVLLTRSIDETKLVRLSTISTATIISLTRTDTYPE
jgi:hypothetical protein